MQGIGNHGGDGASGELPRPMSQHRLGEIGAHHPTAKAWLTRQCKTHVERAGAQIHERAPRPPLPAERRDSLTTPTLVDVEAEQVVEQIVPRRDLREYAPDVCTLVAPTGRRLEGRALLCFRRRHSEKLSRRDSATQAPRLAQHVRDA